MNKILEFFNLDQKINWRIEILAGLTVAMTMIPESLSFAVLAGFPPLSGLYAAFIAGLVAAMFGGRPGLISGGAGATVVTLIGLIKLHGLDYAFAAVAMAGIIQLIVGIFKWAKYIRLVPSSVMYGFVNGLAVIIFSAQLEQFKTAAPDGQMEWLTGTPMMIMAGLVALTVLITWLFPKISKAVPSSLMAIIVVFTIVLVLNRGRYLSYQWFSSAISYSKCSSDLGNFHDYPSCWGYSCRCGAYRGAFDSKSR